MHVTADVATLKYELEQAVSRRSHAIAAASADADMTMT